MSRGRVLSQRRACALHLRNSNAESSSYAGERERKSTLAMVAPRPNLKPAMSQAEAITFRSRGHVAFLTD